MSMQTVTTIGNGSAVFDHLLALTRIAETEALSAALDLRLVELVKIRVSQLNACSYCLRMHTTAAVVAGENADRLAVLAAWRDTDYFSPTERAALAQAEAVTILDQDDSAAAEASALDEKQLAAVTWVASVMNTMNRVVKANNGRVGP